MTDTVTIENEVPAGFVEVIRDRLEAFAKRARAKGLPIPVLTVGDALKRKRHSDTGPRHDPEDACPTTTWHPVTITGETPRLGPWSLVASIDSVEGRPFFRPVPGSDVPVEFRDADPERCDYCNVRRYRTETFIIRHDEDDTFRQVGRQCIRDFLGHDIGTIVAYYERLGSLLDEPEGGFVSFERPTWTPAEVILQAARVVSVDGKYHKSADVDSSTKSKVWEFLTPPSNAARLDWYQRFVAKYTAQPELAQRIYDATMSALETLDTKSDWSYNVKVATSAKYIEARQVGVVVSAVILGLRAVEDALTTKSNTSQHVGKVGERITTSATVEDIRYIDSQWGGSYLVTFRDIDGNILKWFASSDPFRPSFVSYGTYSVADNIGKNINLVGSVKKHDAYKGQAQTVLTRCKVEVVA